MENNFCTRFRTLHNIWNQKPNLATFGTGRSLGQAAPSITMRNSGNKKIKFLNLSDNEINP